MTLDHLTADANTAIDLMIARAGEHAKAHIFNLGAAQAERSNRSIAQHRRYHRERCAALRYRFRRLWFS